MRTVTAGVVGVAVEEGAADAGEVVVPAEAVGADGSRDVNGVTAVDSEEMREERAERTERTPLVLMENELRGRALVLWRACGGQSVCAEGVDTYAGTPVGVATSSTGEA